MREQLQELYNKFYNNDVFIVGGGYSVGNLNVDYLQDNFQDIGPVLDQILGILGTPQQLILQLLRITNRGNLCGSKVARDLRDNKRLWTAVAFEPLNYNHGVVNLNVLSNRLDDIGNSDALIISTNRGVDERCLLEMIAKTWNPTNMRWLDNDEVYVLEVVW